MKKQRNNSLYNLLPLLILFITQSCQEKTQSLKEEPTFKSSSTPQPTEESPEGMVWIPGGEFIMGTDEKDAYPAEKPAVNVQVSGFWMDTHEVTNSEFQKFVEETGYITIAEQKPDWEDLKKQVPPGTPKPDDSVLVPGSMVFTPPSFPVPTQDITLWWSWVEGASWKHPEGPESNIEGRENHPVVHIAYADAVAYAEWAGKRLPSELEWEFAARGGVKGKRFAWGDELTPNGTYLANTFQGTFPHENKVSDGFEGTSPVKTYPPNTYGLYDMIGNVWELTSDWYDALKLARLAGEAPKLDAGMNPCYNPENPYARERVIKGGSYLCAENYCVNYRPSARQGQAFDSGTSNVGFRLVKDPSPKALSLADSE
ncbi:Formylglycine-generating enzyme, required for sulfatase activity, contains SUMF1/FGE domain [Algoriphagus faecimaris]|uniref:Formylglycine-generating enzyme, required for sulfatase activity, contains SUMF1/FGE domain n=1 Tax=Algoriphagus faecimaris TaxID=686796 RepID=A0A1G6VGR8_9BACT|nr:formylglycine-generating enzyme family protein [Algoriphagus faecimaris]SDD52563.1 Formylglycine-generating enzyme, required for sulfatase activity, contains SUMF1/FGE domain [Algoriphagus faecimaris]